MAVTGATHPRVEHLLAGIIPGLPRVELIHTVVSTESGPEWVHNLFMAERGELDAPYVICWEGSIMDESYAGEGYWMGLGEDPQTGRQITSLEWLVELGCWGPVVQCNITERGIVEGQGGCMQMGGICIGCTMPGFPDKFSPFYETPPGSLLSSNTARVFGGFMRRMRNVSRQDKNMHSRWDRDAPSGWARA
ncbi:MAG: hypothetical protein ABR577_20260, partial [Pyrinomonadaceae bacterium]